MCELFSRELVNICAQLNIGLTPIGPKNENSFVNQTLGTVWGKIDSENLSCSFFKHKADELITKIQNTMHAKYVLLTDVHEIMDRVNSVAHVCPIFKCFRQPANSLMSRFNNNHSVLILLTPPPPSGERLGNLPNIICQIVLGLSIESRPRKSLYVLCFPSDATGSHFVIQTKQCERESAK